MNRLNAPIILIALTLVMLVIKNDEKIQMAVVSIATAEEVMAAPAARSNIFGFCSCHFRHTYSAIARRTCWGTGYKLLISEKI